MENELFNLSIDLGTENLMIDTDDLEKGSLTEEKVEKNEKTPSDDGVEEFTLNENGELVLLTEKKPEENTKVEIDTTEKENTEEKVKADAGEKDGKVTPSYSPFAVSIKESGILPSLDLDALNELPMNEQAEFLIESMEKEIDERILEQAKQMPEEVFFYINNLRRGVPLAELLRHEEQYFNVKSISEVNLKEEEAKDLRAMVMREYYRKTAPSMKNDKVEKLISEAQLTGDDIEESVSYLSELKAEQKKEEAAMVIRAETNRTKYQEQYNEWATNVKTKVAEMDEVVPGVKLSKKQKDVVYESMIKPVRFDKLEDGRSVPITRAMDVRSKNPDLFDIRLNAFIEAGLFDEKIKKEEFLKKAKTEAMKDLGKSLERDKEFNLAKQKDNDDDGGNLFESLSRATNRK